MMKSACIAIVFCLMPIVAQPASAQVYGAKEIIKAIGRYLGREAGGEATEQAIKKMTREVGDELIERTAQKVIREGGEKSLVEVGELVAKHGPDVVRALDNAPDALPLLKLLDELPADEIGKAASRLAAGSAGKELATLSTKLGTTVLRSEVKHPGVGVLFARALGSDAELSLKLTADQAVQIGRHVDDIAKLPAAQQSQLLVLISSNADRFSAFVGRFVEKNPGKVLFTTASTTIVLANSDAIFGEGEIEIGPDGKPIFKPNGEPVRRQSGLFPDAAKGVGDTVKAPIQWTLYLVGGIIAVAFALFAGSKVWKQIQKDRHEFQKETATGKSQKKK